MSQSVRKEAFKPLPNGRVRRMSRRELLAELERVDRAFAGESLPLEADAY